MITVRANARNATYISDDLITSGSVGIPVTFVLSEDFDGLSAIAVFEGSGTARDVALIGNTCVVPHEVVATAGGYLRVGIYASNAEGTIVIPTVWAGNKMILQGTEPSELDPSEPTPSWAAQVQAAAAEAVQTSEEAIEIAGGAEAAAEEARQSASAAAASATEAGQSANAAGTAQAAAEEASDEAASARDAAVAAQGSAASSAQAAAGSATAAAASEAAAREVKESIPQDYTALSENVSDLKSQTAHIAAPEETEADLYICDSNGNVIAKFQDGHIQTKEFDSANINVDIDDDYIPSINPTDADSDLDIADERGNTIARFKDGNIQTKGFNSRAITPKIVTVKKDGTGDYMTVRAAVDSITDASSAERPYVIEIYPGTYNVFDDFTQEEIETAGEDDYSQDGSAFVGIVLRDGISLRGIGNRTDVVLHGELDPDTYDATLRNNVSTLNLYDTMSLENLTVTAKNIRYCVHDDSPPTLPYFYRHVKNCKFSISVPTSGSEGKTWGEGARQGKTTVLEDSDFETCLLWHSDNTASATRAVNLTIKNCTAQFLTIRNVNHNVFNNVHIYGGNFGIVRFTFDNGTVQTYQMSIDGDMRDAMVYAPADFNYKTGDITVFPTNGTMALQNGMLVRPNFSPFWTSGSLVVVTDPHEAYGVVVGIDDHFVYVQKSGCFNAERIGLQNVSVGDSVTVTQSGALELNGAGEKFGVVFASFTDYGAYVRRI